MWTVVYETTSDGHARGISYQFFEKQENAQKRYDELIKEEKSPTMRPYYPPQDDQFRR